MALPFEITVGGAGPFDPAPDTIKIVLPFTLGRLWYVEQRAVGPLTSGEILPDTVLGGFSLVGGLKFNAGDKYFIHDVGEAYTSSASSYSNGFNFGRVMTAMFGRLGWKQTPGTGVPVLSSNNLVAKSGRCFNDGSFHALVTLLNIKSVMEGAAASDDDFNDYIESLQRAIILRSLNGIFSEPEYIGQTLLYQRWRWHDTSIPNAGKFVGVRIKVPPAVEMATQIDSVALYFDSDVSFNLYLFNDVKEAPVMTVPVTAVANTQTVISLTDMILNHIGPSNHGGVFFLGYFQNDLGSAQALRENDLQFNYNTIFGYSMIETNATGGTGFDRLNVGYAVQSYGLNPFISVWRDHTWIITAKAALFDNVIGLQMAAAIVEQILFSQRSNKEQRVLADSNAQIMGSMALEGAAPISDSPQTTGLKKQIAQELTRMKKSFFPPPKAQSISICCS